MATAIESSVKTESPGDAYAWPAFEAVEHGVREARRAFELAGAKLPIMTKFATRFAEEKA
jgi:hypothetical protein